MIEKRTTVVCIKVADAWDCYVGRGACPRTGRKFEGAVFSNPFSLRDYTFAECARLYFQHLRDKPWIVDRCKAELAGKVLGCWCKQPGPCHAVILANLANGKTLAEIEDEWRGAGLLTETADLFGGGA